MEQSEFTRSTRAERTLTVALSSLAFVLLLWAGYQRLHDPLGTPHSNQLILIAAAFVLQSVAPFVRRRPLQLSLVAASIPLIIAAVIAQ